MLLGFGLVVTLAAVIISEENWRGDRAWAALEQDFKARDESLALTPIETLSIPDDQNFFKTPLLAQLLYPKPGDSAYPFSRLLAEMSIMRQSGGQLAEFETTSKGFVALRASLKRAKLITEPDTDNAAADVLRAMRSLKPLFDEIRMSARLQKKGGPIESGRGMEFPWTALVHLGQALRVQAAAEIELDRVDQAFEDLGALQVLALRTSTHPPGVVALLTGVYLQKLAADQVSDGCQRHLWREAQLATFQSILVGLEPMEGFDRAARLERAHTINTFSSAENGITFGPLTLPQWLLRGWVQQNKVAYCQAFQEEVFSNFTVKPERVTPRANVPVRTRTPVKSPSKFVSLYHWLPQIALHGYYEITCAYGESVDELHLDLVAWGIERHRLTLGHYPKTLAELVPKSVSELPVSVFGGHPFSYATLPDGSYQIFSVGKNGRDDGGADDDIILRISNAPLAP
jgi:hypothetical protein